ncbi:tetratricopeptide repeat protein [Leucobacter sp.]
MNSDESVLQKALLLLDRGQPKSAEPLLRALIRSTESSADHTALLLRGLVALGECLAVTGRPAEARRLLERVTSFDAAGEAIDFAHERARELLEELDE